MWWCQEMCYPCPFPSPVVCVCVRVWVYVCTLVNVRQNRLPGRYYYWWCADHFQYECKEWQEALNILDMVDMSLTHTSFLHSSVNQHNADVDNSLPVKGVSICLGAFPCFGSFMLPDGNKVEPISERPPFWGETILRKDHCDHPDERPPWWNTNLMRDCSGVRLPWWETTLMKDTLMRDHPDKIPPWWETTLIKYHPHERPPWWKTPSWETSLIKYHPDERPPWWMTVPPFRPFFSLFFWDLSLHTFM